MKILGIETSHDDTSIAILENGKIVDMFTISQVDIFKEFGGTIPEISSREHVQNISIIHDLLLKKHDLTTIDYIAYTKEPGLIGTLQVGFLFANALSLSLNKPLIPINHLEGHFFSATITNEVKFPALCLLVSGGHTQLIYAKNYFETTIIGETLDDAVGEVFDKVSRRLNTGFPGGPAIDKIFNLYKGDYIHFTQPHTENKYDFSFSGLKSQVLNYCNITEMKNIKLNKEQIASSFQKTAVEYLISKTKLALKEYNVNSLILGGGVSANSFLRNEFKNLHTNVIIPDMKYTTDNGAMIAQVAYLRLIKKE
ncbi:tRNA (adenosine(37)-N6)-threonylcarbamoyltransferase complex transferase subunit TsaD [Mycoplasmopsis anatis]|uniref:tRNA N6-adenosine threonylcarbamoyltransferase n=1 Tax=Mycoplasmopsis anatis TaxID=171279 RepID=A0A9Q3L5X8_9BACT|nr:tRNA (adenosine(37)-N6)-threonylcarbamoyltransferase complex transferase subunit TsaD [Mycoplasmopsis anatis]MBW0594287.1 tRNA (adenosine(37)-N6)-threonylcarbamoyltransferase complex transferase subunit TsaD [Mycoplasmopsis anatis]MBW0595110.1 tRNA (adenosine(37)-N6)-threonylcarbamoyltransferase complex transferase subunit TsaD [Mycoplasmopsis anatis]MBW0596396.1 tRNA (adenosine(37)-N6)-threonylcarbamoyltransferase complex transferase subunit TsaD [Mycoplasmopsis anatis]MBW0596520.1 tRNA (ad